MADTEQNAFQQSGNSNALQFHCPYCRGHRLQVATNTQFEASTGVTSKMVVTTITNKNTRYWCCSDCGNTFPFPQDVKQQVDAKLKTIEEAKLGAIVSVVISGICLFFFPALSVIFLILAALNQYWALPVAKKEAEKLQQEYEDLLSKCSG